MKSSEDLRIRRTKAALFEAFFSALEEMTFDELTVNSLCERANIRRATFYKHYVDKYDFFTSIIRALRLHFDTFRWPSDGSMTTKEYYVAYAKRIVEYINEHSRVVDNMLKSNLMTTVYSIITEQNYIHTRDLLTKSVSEGMSLKASPDVLAAMCVGSVATAIYTWLLDGKKKDAGELADEIGNVVATMI